MSVKVDVVFCRGWGYSKKFIALKQEIEDKFEGLNITGNATPEKTGYFEVQVNGELIHSKKNGDGFVDDDSKLDKIIKAVEAAQK